MPLRVMQIFVPRSPERDPNDLLEGRRVLGRWRDIETEQVVLHLLVPAEETEPIMDRFEQVYADVEGFHVVLLPVEGVLPRPKADPQDSEPETVDQENGATAHRISREELYTEIIESLDLSRVFLSMTILSSIVAAVGLLRNDVAVIIGAMVIAPLLGPNVAMSLGITLGDFNLLRRALLTNLAGIVVAFGFAVCMGLLLTVDASVPSIASRTRVGLGDILLALAAGSAGTLAFTRGLSGAVIGVMVAVALVPPLVVCGMLVGQGDLATAGGAFLLVVANVICVNLAGVATFIVQGVRPRSWWEAERARAATHRAIVIWIALLTILGLVLWVDR